MPYSKPIAHLMVRVQLETCRASTLTGEIRKLMQERKIGSIIVTDDNNKVEGIFTERDYLLKVAGKEALREKLPIRRFMTENPTCLQREAPISQALLLMRKGRFRHIPIVASDGHVEGIVSIKDVLDYIIDQQLSAELMQTG